MTCLTSLEFTVVLAAVAALWVVCALILARVVWHNYFAGKPAFILTFSAMLWWLFTVALDLASQGLSCKVGWSLAAWPGITLLPVAWAFFLFDYTLNTSKRKKTSRLLIYLGLPFLVSIIAATNSQTNLLYGTGTRLVSEEAKTFVVFDHGPLFYVIAAGLYIFMASALAVLIYALVKAKRNIRPFLVILVIITAAPLVANIAYVVWGLTIFNYDPTPFMFAFALIAFTWMLLNNTMMDTEAQGRQLLFYATHDPVIIIDAGGRFAGANPAARPMFHNKFPRVGERLDHLEKIAPIVTSLVETGKLDPTEVIEFEDRAYDLRALPIPSPIQTPKNLLGWSISLVDITERERSAEALRKAVVRAETAERTKSQFLAMISHELRTPMTSVKGGLDLALLGVVGEVSAPVKSLLMIAQRNSVRLLKLIDDVHDLQKIDLSEITLDLQDLAAAEFLREAIQEHEVYASNAGVTISIVLNNVDEQARVRVDPHRLKQVLGNVLTNAVKFSPEGGQVTCEAFLGDAMLRLSIQDRGIGIPENSENLVFGRFDQIDSPLRRKTGGSGLGMHISKLLIERMEGSISYESRLGDGTTFHIDMPLSP